MCNWAFIKPCPFGAVRECGHLDAIPALSRSDARKLQEATEADDDLAVERIGLRQPSIQIA
jgi:hypothetical protein